MKLISDFDKKRDKELKKIIRAAHFWRAGQSIMFDLTCQIFLLIISLFIIVECSTPWFYLLVLLAGGLAVSIFRKFKRPFTWEKRIDAMLNIYEPFNTAAFIEFQENVRQEGRLTVNILEDWLDTERVQSHSKRGEVPLFTNRVMPGSYVRGRYENQKGE